jgi:transposase
MTALKLSIACSLQAHQAAVMRLAAVPGYGIDSAEHVITEVVPPRPRSPRPGQLAFWVGVCPGSEESAEVSRSNRSPN